MLQKTMTINNVDNMGYDPEERLAVCERFLNSLGAKMTSHSMDERGWTVHGKWQGVPSWPTGVTRPDGKPERSYVVTEAYPVLKGGSNELLVTVKCSKRGRPTLTRRFRYEIKRLLDDEGLFRNSVMAIACGYERMMRRTRP